VQTNICEEYPSFWASETTNVFHLKIVFLPFKITHFFNSVGVNSRSTFFNVN